MYATPRKGSFKPVVGIIGTRRPVIDCLASCLKRWEKSRFDGSAAELREIPARFNRPNAGFTYLLMHAPSPGESIQVR
jgi:hypothetical protein